LVLDSSALRRPVKHGVIYTRPWSVAFVLDIVGYSTDTDLSTLRVIEPACGDGAFVAEIVRRLCASARTFSRDLREATDAITAMDTDPESVRRTRDGIIGILTTNGLRLADAESLASKWVIEDDFLLGAKSVTKADFVVGNPPYIRPEHMDASILERYRNAWPTMRGRADIYIGFFEAGLSRLRDQNSRLAYLCADRWMRNGYGSALRASVLKNYAVEIAVELHGVDVFEQRVAAYPSLVVISRGQIASRMVAQATTDFAEGDAVTFAAAYRAGMPPESLSSPKLKVRRAPSHSNDAASWPALGSLNLTRLRNLEDRLPTLLQSGIEIGIGPATGADKIYFTKDSGLVERSRLQKVIQPSDLGQGCNWGGTYLVNPWDGDHLVDLAEYPLLRSYFDSNRERLESRYVAEKHPLEWWRTIDKPQWDRYAVSKLLIPDLKRRVSPTLDTSGFLPKHTLYFLTSKTWDLEVLGGLLMSDIVNSFVEAYSVRFSSGHMRVSAQYLDKIRVPEYTSLTTRQRTALRTAFLTRNAAAANKVTAALYGD
jgi:hypothetical protein